MDKNLFDDLTRVLVHDYYRCQKSYESFLWAEFQKRYEGKTSKHLMDSYDAYSDFIRYLYEFYVGNIKRNVTKSLKVTTEQIEEVLNEEANKIIRFRQFRTGEREINVPKEFARDFRNIRNYNSHSDHKRFSRDDLSLAIFFKRYHHIIEILYHYPSWLWSVRGKNDYDWSDVERFSLEVEDKVLEILAKRLPSL